MKARSWIPSSKCCRPCCVMTLCTPIGGGMLLCWLHAWALGIELDRDRSAA